MFPGTLEYKTHSIMSDACVCVLRPLKGSIAPDTPLLMCVYVCVCGTCGVCVCAPSSAEGQRGPEAPCGGAGRHPVHPAHHHVLGHPAVERPPPGRQLRHARRGLGLLHLPHQPGLHQGTAPPLEHQHTGSVWSRPAPRRHSKPSNRLVILGLFFTSKV